MKKLLITLNVSLSQLSSSTQNRVENLDEADHPQDKDNDSYDYDLVDEPPQSIYNIN